MSKPKILEHKLSIHTHHESEMSYGLTDDDNSWKTLASIKEKKQGQLQDAIESVVKSLPKGQHLTAHQVYKRAQEMGVKVSLSTVYRTLNLLSLTGNVSTVSGEQGRRYESREIGDDHDHLICLKCGLTVEFSDDLLKGFGKVVSERKGFDHHSSRFDIFGFCNQCKLQREDLKVDKAIIALEDIIANWQDLTDSLEQAGQALENGKTARGLDNMQQALKTMTSACEQLKSIITSFE